VELPPGAELVRTTDVFDEDTVPAGLLRDHRVAANTWGRLVVHSGALKFGFTGEDEFDVTAGDHAVIPPSVVHHVRIVGPVRFAVEFHRPTEA